MIEFDILIIHLSYCSLGIPNTMALLMLLGYFMCNVLLAWAALQQPYITKTLSPPHHKIKIIGCIWLYLSLNQKFN